MSDELKAGVLMGLLVVGMLIVFWLIAGCIVFGQINITQANVVSAYDGDVLIYEGKLAYINISSGGMTTTVKIYSRLWPIQIVKETYSGSNIRVVPKK